MNKQITEDFVSFETAKLLKEKGFDELCFALYNPEEELIQCGVKLSNTQVGRVPGSYSAPTHQMAFKWLREVHNIEISISYGFPFIDGQQIFKYYWCPVKVTKKGLEYPMDNPNTAEFIEEMADSYEQAVEAALLYVLKNLI